MRELERVMPQRDCLRLRSPGVSLCEVHSLTPRSSHAFQALAHSQATLLQMTTISMRTHHYCASLTGKSFWATLTRISLVASWRSEVVNAGANPYHLIDLALTFSRWTRGISA